jgi:ribosomal protein S18 acetylase RimI-like enzyme
MERSKAKPNRLIRWWCSGDMTECLEIEEQEFLFPWSEAEWTNTLRVRGVRCLVVEIGGRVAGFAMYQIGDGTWNINNLGVRKSRQRDGVGRWLVQEICRKAVVSKASRVTACVADHNLDGQLFFKALGFNCDHVLSGFFKTGGEEADAYHFVKPVGSGRTDDLWLARNQACGGTKS